MRTVQSYNPLSMDNVQSGTIFSTTIPTTTTLPPSLPYVDTIYSHAEKNFNTLYPNSDYVKSSYIQSNGVPYSVTIRSGVGVNTGDITGGQAIFRHTGGTEIVCPASGTENSGSFKDVIANCDDASGSTSKTNLGEWSLISVRINTSTGDYVEYLSNGSIQGSKSNLANGSSTSSSHSLNLSSNFGYFVHDDVYPPNVTTFSVSQTEFTEGNNTNITLTLTASEVCGSNACGGVSRYGIYLRPKSGGNNFSFVLGYFNGSTNNPPSSAPNPGTVTVTLTIPYSFTGDDVEAWYFIIDTLGNWIEDGYTTISRN